MWGPLYPAEPAAPGATGTPRQGIRRRGTKTYVHVQAPLAQPAGALAASRSLSIIHAEELSWPLAGLGLLRRQHHCGGARGWAQCPAQGEVVGGSQPVTLSEGSELRVQAQGIRWPGREARAALGVIPAWGVPPSSCGSFKSRLAGVWEVSGGARGEGGSGCPGLGSGTHPRRDTGHRGKALPWGPRPAAPAGGQTAQTMDAPPELGGGRQTCLLGVTLLLRSTLTQPRVLNVTCAHPWAWLAPSEPPPGRDAGPSGSQCNLHPPPPPPRTRLRPRAWGGENKAPT